MLSSKTSRRRLALALLVSFFAGSSVNPRQAVAQGGYCVWTVITTTYTDRATGVVLLVEQSWELNYCCPGDFRCGIHNA
jgi:hypothetical protein